MFLKVSKIKASTLCASSALLVLGGFMSINLAGCGGGGGNSGGSFGSPTATPGIQGITFLLQLQNGQLSNGGTLTLTPAAGTNSPVLNGTASSAGIVSFPAVQPGTYTATFVLKSASGTTFSTTNTTIVVTRDSNQRFLLLQDQGVGTASNFAVSGTVRRNPGATATPTATSTPTATPTPRPTSTVGPIPVNTPVLSPTDIPTAIPTNTPVPFRTPFDPLSVSNCSISSTPVTEPVLIEVIDLDSSKGQPTIAQLLRTGENSNGGTYTIFLPYRPSAFQVRVGRFDVNNLRFAGLSAVSNFNGATVVNGVSTVRNLDVCVNIGAAPQFARITPIPTATATLAPTPFGATAGPTTAATAAP